MQYTHGIRDIGSVGDALLLALGHAAYNEKTAGRAGERQTIDSSPQDRSRAMHDASDATETARTSGAHQPAPQPEPAAREWVCPGVPYGRRVVTGIGVTLAAALFFFLALWQGASMLVSSIIGAIFIGGFILYLGVVAPPPFTLRLDTAGIERRERGRETVQVAWRDIAKIKEERFKSGKAVSLAVFKRVGERGLYRAFIVYRDDIPDFDGLRAALREGAPAERPWIVETAHE